MKTRIILIASLLGSAVISFLAMYGLWWLAGVV